MCRLGILVSRWFCAGSPTLYLRAAVLQFPLFQLTQLRGLRSAHMHALRPRLHELSLPAQWEVTLSELERLARRVAELVGALVQWGATCTPIAHTLVVALSLRAHFGHSVPVHDP
jgi:hypothetical protein